MAVFGTARRPRAELTEALQFHDGHAWFAARIERRIKQHRAMAGRQPETIAVRPACAGGGIIVEGVGERHGGDIGGTHRRTRMTRFRLFHRVHGERANGIPHFLMSDFIFVRQLQRFTPRAELARSCAIAASSRAGLDGAKAWLAPSGNRRKAFVNASAMFLYATLQRFRPRKRFRRDLCLIVAALGHYPGHQHVTRGGRFVDLWRDRHSPPSGVLRIKSHSFPLTCVRAVTVFAVGFWHDHNSLTSLILDTEGEVHASRTRRGRGNEI